MTRYHRSLTAAAWTIVGALGALGVLSIASVGLLVLPIAGALAALLASRTEPRPLGMIVGAGLVLLAIGLAGQFDGVPACTGAGVSDAPAHGQPSRCESGGVPSLAFVLAGLGAVIGAAIAAVRHR